MQGTEQQSRKIGSVHRMVCLNFGESQRTSVLQLQYKTVQEEMQNSNYSNKSLTT